MSDDQAPAERPAPTNVIQALARVMEDLPGIGRDSTASAAQGGYAYRSIEAITAAAQHLLGRYGVVFVPRVIDRPPPVQLMVNSKPWTEEQMTIAYRVYGPGGLEDFIEVGPLVALGRDNVDKGTNKCMTQAFKYALLQLLCIGDNKDDADSGGTQADSHPDQDPEKWFKASGWKDKAEHDTSLIAARGEAAALVPESRSQIKDWMKSKGLGWELGWTRAEVDELKSRTEALIPPGAREAQEPPEAPVPPSDPQTPAPAPESGGSAEPEPMPWDNMPTLPPMPEPGSAVASMVEAMSPSELSEALLARGLGVSGNTKVRQGRLIKALEGEADPPAAPAT
jgi:hypothetical protein